MMKTTIAALLLAACCVLPAAAEDDEPTGPSFDCSKASTAGEKTVCDAPGLGWYDRQVAKAYDVAKKAAGASGEAALKEGQLAFLKKRDACAGDDSYDCVQKAYSARLAELAKSAGAANFEYGDYAADNGGLSLARYGKDAALTISTVGGGDHTCAFETDRATADAKGKISYVAKYEGMEESCEITGTPDGDSLTITASSGCSYWCGMRAELNGTFKKAP